jgi:uncharacterized protein
VDAATVRRWSTTALNALRRHQREIDELNVYPVPDGDTGTNLVLTMTAANEAAQTSEDPMSALANGAFFGARGNSGIIFSQLLRGMAETLRDAGDLATAFERASEAAYRAVAAPVEGTILTVAAAAAAAARGHQGSAQVARAAAAAAREALARTPEQLPILARAGVVDAGGRGLVVLLDALVEVLTGEPAPTEAFPPPVRRLPLTIAREAGSSEYGYEVQYLLDGADDAQIKALKAKLGTLGDSLVVVGRDPTWNVHVHVNDVGAAIEAGVDAGRPYRITVTRFADQMEADTAKQSEATRQQAGSLDASRTRPGQFDDWTQGEGPTSTSAVVVVCTGDGLAELFRAEGATVVAGTPSTAEILDAIKQTAASCVVVLPNDPNVTAVANAAATEARAAGTRAGVIPTRSPVQALAALAVRDPQRQFEDDVIAMAEAAGACRYAEVTVASREALTVAGRCQPGDILGLVEGEVNLIGRDLAQTCQLLLDRLLAGGGELVTLVAGADAPDGLGEALRGHVAAQWRFVEVQCYEGGQPHYPLLVGVE